ncbi:MAG: C25 family cysteine peptidase [candidate division WOR-3 bacterium]
MKKLVYFLFIFLLGFGELKIKSFNYSQGEIEITLEEPKIEVKEIPEGRFSIISLPVSGQSVEEGRPLLPVIREFYQIPEEGQPEIEIKSFEKREIDLVYPIYPLQPPIPKTGEKPPFTMDKDFYERDFYYPEKLAEINLIGYIRGRRIIVFEVYPIRYNPKKNKIEFYSKINLEIKIKNGNLGKTFQKIRNFYSLPFEKRVKDLIINYKYYEIDPPILPIGYLIIVPDEWYNNLLPLAEWRLRKGYKVWVKKLSEVGGGSADVVRNYILNAYNNWPVKPSYVLLVGDVDKIGYFTGQGSGNPPTDLNFSLMTSGDYLPDIDVSRLSVANSIQLDSFVSKVIKYEKNEWITERDWLKKSYFIASSDGGNHQVAESTHQYCMRLQRRFGVICDSLYLYYNSGTPITTAINGGRAWVTYSGHGSYDRWADPNFTSDNVRQLTNIDKVPFVGTYACLSGDFSNSSYPECFSETWIRIGYRGAIGHYASSVTSYWVEDDTFQRRVFDAAYDSNFFWAMGMINKGKLMYFRQMGNTPTTRRYFEMYNLMGDGAIDIYWDIPKELDVSYPRVIPVGSYQLVINVQSSGEPVVNALVCALAKSDTSSHYFGYTDENGEVRFNIFTTQPDSIYITVTGHNLEPHIGACLAMPANQPYVSYLRHYINDDPPRGNGDGIPNPGEELEILTWVKNWGNETAYSVIGKFVSRDTLVTTSDTIKYFNDIGPQDSTFTGEDGFNLTISQNVFNGYNIRCSLLLKDINDSLWVSSFSIIVGTPILSYEDFCVKDSFSQRPNGRIDPGETADVLIKIRNTGLGHGYNVYAILKSSDTLFYIIDSFASFGTVLRGDTAINFNDHFKVFASQLIRPETEILCTLKLYADNYERITTFRIPIGRLTITDPIPDNRQPEPLYYAYDDVDTFYQQCEPFEWVEIRNVGTRLPITSDDQTIRIPLPFPIYYYGVRYRDSLSVCGNGWISPVRTTSTSYTNQPLPDPTSTNPNAMICVNWDDLYPPYGNGIWFYYDTLNHRMILEWDSVHYYNPREQWDKFQIIIYDTSIQTPTGDNVIKFQYLTANNYFSNTVGIEDQTNTIGICAVYNNSYHRASAQLQPRRAIKFVTGPPLPSVIYEVSLKRLNNKKELPTILNSISVYFPQRSKIIIYDISGKKIWELKSKEKIITKLSKGVYFIKTEREKYKIIIIN